MPDNVAFLFAAFAIVWLLIFGYFLFVGGRINSLRQDIDLLRDELGPRPDGAVGRTASDGQADEPIGGGARRE